MKAQLFLFFALAVSPHVMADNKFVSGPGQVDLIELYTSEGCSSCPSAERRMNECAKDEGLWTDSFATM